MKRNILLALVAALTLSMIVTDLAFAQGYGPGGNGLIAGTGITQEVTLSNYMPAAMADVLGMSEEDVNVRLESGETFYTIALSLGYTSEQLPALMTSVRDKAIELASAAGAISVDQSNFLFGNQYSGNGAGTTSMYSTGDGTGICDGTCIPQNLSLETGSSMMRRGGRR